MIIHRMETRPAPEPPVKFYKTIALSFLVITLFLLGVVIFTTTKKANITIIAKEDTKNVNLIVNVTTQTDDKSITGMVSSTIFTFSQAYYPTNAKPIDGIAEGQVTIYNKSNTEQPLVKTTRLLTSNNILFRLKDNVTAPANGQITANVYADVTGSAGDIGPAEFTIPGLKPERQKVVYAESTTAMAGGSRSIKVLTENDLEDAKKDFKNKIQEAFLKNLSSPDNGQYNQKIATIVQEELSVSNKPGDEVTEFTITGKNTFAYVFYNQEELNDLINKEISSKIDLNLEKILSTTQEPQLSLLSRGVAIDSAQLSVNQDILVTLDANSTKLSAQNFLSKKKDEIERYLLSLPHTSGVDIKISPQWSRTTPSVADKIKIVVKNIQ